MAKYVAASKRRTQKGFSHIFGSQPVRSKVVPLSLFAVAMPHIRLSASEVKHGHGGTPLHVATGTANAWGVRELIRLRADVNAQNNNKQAPIDMCRGSNAAVKKLIAEAGGVGSPDWDGVSSRTKNALSPPYGRPMTRPRHEGASAARQKRAAEYRESVGDEGFGSQPGSSSSGLGGKGGKGGKYDQGSKSGNGSKYGS